MVGSCTLECLPSFTEFLFAVFSHTERVVPNCPSEIFLSHREKVGPSWADPAGHVFTEFFLWFFFFLPSFCRTAASGSNRRQMSIREVRAPPPPDPTPPLWTPRSQEGSPLYSSIEKTFYRVFPTEFLQTSPAVARRRPARRGTGFSPCVSENLTGFYRVLLGFTGFFSAEFYSPCSSFRSWLEINRGQYRVFPSVSENVTGFLLFIFTEFFTEFFSTPTRFQSAEFLPSRQFFCLSSPIDRR